MNKDINARIITILVLIFLSPHAWAKEKLNIVTSIMPVHMLVSEVTKGITKPHLLVKRNTSPHHYTLTPKDAKALNQADLVFYIGEELERFLEKPLHNLSRNAEKIALSHAKSVTIFPSRERALWHNEPEHSDEDGHEDEDGNEDEDGHDEHDNHGHHHKGNDLHIWLSPDNAKYMIEAIALQLSEYDPENKTAYQNNAKQAIARMKKTDKKIKSLLKPYTDTPYIVFHDAYQYFERYYDMHSVGALMLTPGIPLGAHTMDNITKAVREHHVTCLFSEPQFDPQRIQTIADHTGSQVSTLDPLATNTTETDHFDALLLGLAESMVSCLKQTESKNEGKHE